jgi:hypothetical protein
MMSLHRDSVFPFRHPCLRANSQVVKTSGCGASQFIQIATRESGCQDWQEPKSKLRSKNRFHKLLVFLCQGDLGIGSKTSERGQNTERGPGEEEPAWESYQGRGVANAAHNLGVY